MSISVQPYTYQGQVYSPAFSDDHPSEDSADEYESPPLSPASPCSPSRSPPRKRKTSCQDFVSKRPRFANKYEEMLQPLSPVTTLPFAQILGPHAPVTVRVNDKVQRTFESVMEAGDVPAMEALLAASAAQINVNQFNCDGRTALQESCLESNLPMAKVLIKYGADPRMTTRDGFSTLQLAAFSGHSPLLMYILSQQNLVK